MAYKFINPYNFVPLGKEKESADKAEERNLKGMIEYSLLTKTPLFIPNTSNDHAIYPEEAKGKSNDDDYHKSYEFFAYEDLSNNEKRKQPGELIAPVIPGSEIRGMLRNYYEILSNSCMSAIDTDVKFSKRTKYSFEPGLIHRISKDEFKLEKKVDDCLLRTTGPNSTVIKRNRPWNDCYVQGSYKEGQTVYVALEPRSNAEKYGSTSTNNGKTLVTRVDGARTSTNYEGYIIKGYESPNGRNEKHCAHVFVKFDGASDEVDIDINKLRDVIIKYADNKLYSNCHEYKEYCDELNNFINGNGKKYFPVYYSEINGKRKSHIYLSPASITREMYDTNILDMIGSYGSCDNIDKLCPACYLFGMLNSDNNVSAASRIRVTDLKVNEEWLKEKFDGEISNIYHDIVTLKELASPKSSSVEFYLKRKNNAWFWTYDYYVSKDGKVKSNKAEINGRKFYWHNINVKEEDYATDIGDDKEKIRRNSIRPLNKNALFNGKIYFDGISKTELSKLVYLVNAGDNNNIEDKAHGYKIGKGKPYGLGSVAMRVDKVTVRTVSINEDSVCVEEKPKDVNCLSKYKWDSDVVAGFEKITDFNVVTDKKYKEYKISYPKVNEKTDDIFEWFKNNYQQNNNGTMGVASFTKRNKMALYEYMEPLNPALVRTELIKQKEDKANSNQSNNNKKGLKTADLNSSKKSEYILGQEYSGIVQGHNAAGGAIIRLENGKTFSVDDDGKKQNKSHVKVVYEGKKNNIHKWKLVD